MTSEENKAVVRRYINELNRRNVAVIDEVVHETFRKAVRRGYQRNLSTYPDYQVEIKEMIAEGEQVVVEWTHRGVQKGLYQGIPPTNKTITGYAVTIYRVVNGQIIDARGIWDQTEIWQQLGVLPDTQTIIDSYNRTDA